MSKFIKSLAVISALAIFATGFTSCKNDEDNDSNTSTVNTGFEGTYYNINVINKLKTVAGENDIPYAQCSVAEVIFKKDGTGTYKIHQMEYDSEDGRQRFNLTEDFHYTKSGQTLNFTVQNEEMKFTIQSDDKLECEDDEREYDKGEIEEIYAYLNIESSSKTATNKVIILGKGSAAIFKNLVSDFEIGKEPGYETENWSSTYEKTDTTDTTTITFRRDTTGAETTGTLSVDEEYGKTYLTIGEEKYLKL